MFYAPSVQLNTSKYKTIEKKSDQSERNTLLEKGPMHVKSKGFFPHNIFKRYNI